MEDFYKVYRDNELVIKTQYPIFRQESLGKNLENQFTFNKHVENGFKQHGNLKSNLTVTLHILVEDRTLSFLLGWFASANRIN